MSLFTKICYATGRGIRGFKSEFKKEESTETCTKETIKDSLDKARKNGDTFLVSVIEEMIKKCPKLDPKDFGIE